ncbi:MAG: thiamine-phosphate kinase [Acidobacteriaceae bacterium]|nr:thiamine-phosphate kinase [Acidobacteriaceae bacterium]
MTKAPSKHLREHSLIDRIRRGSESTKSPWVSLGIGDDCAILHAAADSEILVTTDLTLENRHFRRDRHTPESVGHRALARGLSDLAAMGATPLAAFLSLALPSSMLSTGRGIEWVDRFFAGLHRLGDRYNVPLSGGDTSESPSDLILADIVLIGSAPRCAALRRSGAHAGDALYVTGALGGAAAELAAVLARSEPPATVADLSASHPHLFPEPRLAVGHVLLRRKLATAAIDISDGLSTDLTHLCQASNVRAEIEQAAIPLHPLTKRLTPSGALKAALHGGEDYELLFSAPSGAHVPHTIGEVKLTRIGTLLPPDAKKPLITLVAADDSLKSLRPGGWEHFSDSTKPAN